LLHSPGNQVLRARRQARGLCKFELTVRQEQYLTVSIDHFRPVRDGQGGVGRDTRKCRVTRAAQFRRPSSEIRQMAFGDGRREGRWNP
jgi:hypothetical protein